MNAMDDDAARKKRTRRARRPCGKPHEGPLVYEPFFALVREAFSALLRDFGFSELEATDYGRECCIRFANHTTGIYVDWEWMGEAPLVCLEELAPPSADTERPGKVLNRYSVYDLAEKKCPDRLGRLRGRIPASIGGGKLNDLRRILNEYAEILARLGAEALKGRFQVFRS